MHGYSVSGILTNPKPPNLVRSRRFGSSRNVHGQHIALQAIKRLRWTLPPFPPSPLHKINEFYHYHYQLIQKLTWLFFSDNADFFFTQLRGKKKVILVNSVTSPYIYLWTNIFLLRLSTSKGQSERDLK